MNALNSHQLTSHAVVARANSTISAPTLDILELIFGIHLKGVLLEVLKHIDLLAPLVHSQTKRFSLLFLLFLLLGLPTLHLFLIKLL